MNKLFTLQLLLIYFILLSVITVSHSSFEAESDLLRSNEKLTNKRLSEEERDLWWRRKKEEDAEEEVEPPFEYKGFVLTTIDVEKVEGKKVRFSGAIEADLKDQTGVFLHNIVATDETVDGLIVYEAEEVHPKEVMRTLGKGRKLLFSVHGHGREPQAEFDQVKVARGKFKHHEIVPIFWPTFDLTWRDGILRSYRHDVDVSKASGIALAHALEKVVKEDPLCEISFMAHSMGNRVLEFFATQAHELKLQTKFRNIYMVSADIDRDVFEQDAGTYIVDMLSPQAGGKVYVMYRWDDTALVSSALLLNKGRRLGQTGVNLKKIPSALKGKVKNENMAGFPADSSRHNYNYGDYLIWFYDSK